jgi:magnesium transporter
MNEIDTSVKTEKTASAAPEIRGKQWYCATLATSGTVLSSESDTHTTFINNLGCAAISWVDYVTEGTFETEATEAAKTLGFSEKFSVSFCGQPRLGYQDWDTEMGLKLPSIQVKQEGVETHPLVFLLKKNFILTIHPRSVDRRFSMLRRYAETILKKIPAGLATEDKLTVLLLRVIEYNNERNFENLRKIDERGDELNRSMADPAVPREKIGPQIYLMKHSLLTYLNALWDTLNVIHTLQSGDAELITNDEALLNKVAVASDAVKQQISLAEHMSDVLASGLEVMQTIYNNQLQQLNNKFALVMTYLTIIGTAVLVPNTIATILGSSAFNLQPEDLIWYWPLLIGATILATVMVYLWIKKKGWLPKKMD